VSSSRRVRSVSRHLDYHNAARDSTPSNGGGHAGSCETPLDTFFLKQYLPPRNRWKSVKDCSPSGRTLLPPRRAEYRRADGGWYARRRGIGHGDLETLALTGSCCRRVTCVTVRRLSGR